MKLPIHFGQSPDPTRRSRGQLVLDALGHPNAAAAAEAIGAYAPSDYNGFHLLLADSASAWCLVHRGDRLERIPLGPGVHAITERGFGAAPTPRETVLAARTTNWSRQTDPPTDVDIHRLLSEHADDLWASICVHAPDMNYGTRSSSILRLDGGTGDWHFQHAPGPPCITAFESVPVVWPARRV